MYTIQAKYNSASIMLPEGTVLDETTTAKVYTFLNHPAFANCTIAIMPDAHDGVGTCIGYTQTPNGYVIPAIVGVDINCGMMAFRFALNDNFNFKLFDDVVRTTIPSGFARHRGIKNVSNMMKNQQLSDACEVANRIGGGDLETTMLESVGTLGGGNHFIEIDAVGDGTAMLVIHTGSRHFGKCVCDYHQKRAKELMRDMFVGAAYANLEFFPPGADADAYMHDMRVAQRYADINRATILARIRVALQEAGMPLSAAGQPYTVCHNYIDDNGVIRKGAISAKIGEQVIIPLNMRDGVIFGTGKGNASWNFSAPHGAGRILSRKKAKETIALADYQKSMEGIWTSSVNTSTIDESPMAYKDKDLIVRAIQDTVAIDFIAKPIYNFKAGGE